MSRARPLCTGLAILALVGCASAPPLRRADPRVTRPARAPTPAPAATDLTIPVGSAQVRVSVEGELALEPPPPALARWTERAARMVDAYCDGFPVADLTVRVVREPGRSVGFGEHRVGRWIRVRVGQEVGLGALSRDWVLVHEMLHAAFPVVEREHRWLQEGLSTYLQTVLRARGGVLSDREAWRIYTHSLPRGRPRPGEPALDAAQSQRRIYWGGALFWFAVDVELRRETAGARSIRDVVRAILAQGGNARHRWTTAKVMRVADAATGTRVVSGLYARLGRRAGDVELDRMFAELGVSRVDGRVRLDDAAPLADVRRAITARDDALTQALRALPPR